MMVVSSLTFTAVVVMIILRFQHRVYSSASANYMIKEYEHYWLLEEENRNKLIKLNKEIDETVTELDYTKINDERKGALASCKEAFSNRWQVHVAFEIEFGNDKYLLGFSVNKNESISNAFERYKKEHPKQPKREHILGIFRNYVIAYSKRRRGTASAEYFHDVLQPIKLSL